MEIVDVPRGGVSKAITFNDEHVYGLAESMHKLRDTLCVREPVGCSVYKVGAFRLKVTRSCRMARVYFDTQNFTLTIIDIDYLARIFNLVQQQLRLYIVTMPDVVLCDDCLKFSDVCRTEA